MRGAREQGGLGMCGHMPWRILGHPGLNGDRWLGSYAPCPGMAEPSGERGLGGGGLEDSISHPGLGTSGLAQGPKKAGERPTYHDGWEPQPGLANYARWSARAGL